MTNNRKPNLWVLSALLTLLISLPCAAEKSQPGDHATYAPAILIMGDSLSAGFGMKASESWPNHLQQRLQTENRPHRVINASISGETTNGGLTRLAQVLNTHKPQVVIIELGANDGLRGLPLTLMRENLRRMIKISQDTKTQVLLIGMQLPPNYGPRYTREFTQTFLTLAEEKNIGIVPFLLANVATRRELIQSDGLHPTAAAQRQLLNNVWPHLLPLLQ